MASLVAMMYSSDHSYLVGKIFTTPEVHPPKKWSLITEDFFLFHLIRTMTSLNPSQDDKKINESRYKLTPYTDLEALVYTISFTTSPFCNYNQNSCKQKINFCKRFYFLFKKSDCG